MLKVLLFILIALVLVAVVSMVMLRLMAPTVMRDEQCQRCGKPFKVHPGKKCPGTHDTFLWVKHPDAEVLRRAEQQTEWLASGDPRGFYGAEGAKSMESLYTGTPTEDKVEAAEGTAETATVNDHAPEPDVRTSSGTTKRFSGNMSGADLSDSDLRDSDFRGVNLTGANLSDSDLSGADLSSANLTGADLSDAILRDADLSGTNLTGADLSDADLTGTRMDGANMTGVRMSGARR